MTEVNPAEKRPLVAEKLELPFIWNVLFALGRVAFMLNVMFRLTKSAVRLAEFNTPLPSAEPTGE